MTLRSAPHPITPYHPAATLHAYPQRPPHDSRPQQHPRQQPPIPATPPPLWPELQHTHRQHDAACCCQHIIQGGKALDKGLEDQQGQERPQGFTKT